MKLGYKILGGIGFIFALAVISLAAVRGYTESCKPLLERSLLTDSMKAVTYRCYGPSEVLEYGDVEKPVPFKLRKPTAHKFTEFVARAIEVTFIAKRSG